MRKRRPPLQRAHTRPTRIHTCSLLRKPQGLTTACHRQSLLLLIFSST
jgi:hypothetical protein